MIQIEHLNKTYVSRQGETHIALTDINLTIEDGSVFGIIVQSGAGKSTLVRCLNLLERPTSGSIIINGRDITSLSEKELREFRSSVSMVFQNFSLLQQRTVLRNVMFPLELRHADKKEAEKRARELLELVGLADKCDKYPSQLSGGQQQRVAIATLPVSCWRRGCNRGILADVLRPVWGASGAGNLGHHCYELGFHGACLRNRYSPRRILGANRSKEGFVAP